MSIDYRLNIPPPSEGITRGLQTGDFLAARRTAREQQQAATEQQAKITEAVSALGDNPTPDDYLRLSNRMAAIMPDMSKQMYDRFTNMKTEAQQEWLSFSGQVINALKTKPEVGIRLLEERAEAYENDTDKSNDEQAKAMRVAAESAKLDPAAGVDSMASIIAGLPGGFETLKGLNIWSEEKRTEELHPGVMTLQEIEQNKGLTMIEKWKAETDLTRAKIETEILRPQMIRDELAAAGDLSTKDRTDIEIKYYDRYIKQIQPYYVARQQYDKLLASSQQGTGVGDLALIFGFMRMLDPGSVVRESEFARAAATGGLMRQLMVLGYKIEKGELLEKSQRKEFAELAKIYMEGAENSARKDYIDLRAPVESYNLSARNVFGYDPLGMGMHEKTLLELEEEYESGRISERFDLDELDFSSKGGAWGGSKKSEAAEVEKYLNENSVGWDQDYVQPDATNTNDFVTDLLGD